MTSDDEYRNTLPRETDDHPDSGMPRQLRTQADDDGALSKSEADVAGITPEGLGTYGDDSREPNAQDHRDAES